MLCGMEAERPSIDALTLVGLILLLAPLLTMAHELAGHALTCVATGHLPTQLGAYYIECPSARGWDGRIVAMAGTGMDIVVALIAYLVWRRVRQPLMRLAAWIVAVFKAMTAAGYWAFSGVLGLGDWAPGKDGGMGAMSHPWLWRAFLVVVGVLAYIAIVRWAMRSLDGMLGGGEFAQAVRKRSVLLMYVVNGAVAVAVGLFNPVGFWITLVSAIASSFGGTAGLFNVAFRDVQPGTAHAFHVRRSYTLLIIGILVTAAFAVVLGPTVSLAS